MRPSTSNSEGRPHERLTEGLEQKLSGEAYMPSEMRAIRSRLDFSKIPTSIQIPT